MVDFLSANFSSMTVAQLTSLCREHKITGYSKLKKAALIEKLTLHRIQVAAKNVQAATVTSSQNRDLSISLRSQNLSDPPPGPPILQPVIPIQSTSLSSLAASTSKDQDLRSIPSPLVFEPIGISTTSPIVTEASSTVENRKPLLSIPSSRTDNNAILANKRSAPISQQDNEPQPSKKPRLSTSVKDAIIPRPVLKDFPHVKQNITPKPMLFKHPTVSKPRSSNRNARFIPLRPASNKQGSITQKSAVNQHVEPWGIFQPFVVQEDPKILIQNITIPPSLSQRKRVKGLALILRDLNDQDRHTCCLVNRLLRYAVYVSAQFLLCEEFPGRRTQSILAHAQDCYSDLWPYLRFRRREVHSLKTLYTRNFLSRYAPNPASDLIWSNPGRGDDLARALRLTLSRLWFVVSLYGDSGRAFLEDQVTRVKPLPGDEVWEVTVRNSKDSSFSLHVLGMTGEAIGSQRRIEAMTHGLRQDWGSHISTLQEDPTRSIWKCLRCANEEEFALGISKAWLKRIAAEGELGLMKRRVAERYVMASVVANSVSGKAMNHQQMALQTAGIPFEPTGPSSVKSKNLHLFLSEHHHVESVHFTSRSRGFHPAIASVQTTHREYFVLQDNGLQIGCEEEGVSEVWMNILGCEKDGTPRLVN